MCRNELLIAAAVLSLGGTTLQLLSQQEKAGGLGVGGLLCSQFEAGPRMPMLVTQHGEWRSLTAQSLSLEPAWGVQAIRSCGRGRAPL